MGKKILSISISIMIILCGIIIPKIYAENFTISIPNTKVKPGEELKVYINLENIKDYTISKINLTTDIYLEPVLDTANTGMTINDTKFDSVNKTFTIENIPNGVKTICVLYAIPSYIANGTAIKLSYDIYSIETIDAEGNVQEKVEEKNIFDITVMSEELKEQDKDTPNNEETNNQTDNKETNNQTEDKQSNNEPNNQNQSNDNNKTNSNNNKQENNIRST